MTTDGEKQGGHEKHSKRAGEPDPGLDPRPYESSHPSEEAVQRTAAEDRALDAVGEGAAGDGAEGARVASERDDLTDAAWTEDGDRAGDEVELVDQPDQPNMGTPHTAPAPDAPRRHRT